MNIAPLNNLNINNNFQTKSAFPFFGLKLNNPLQKDTLSFTGTLKNSFGTKAQALEYYKRIGHSVMESLEEDDDITAFETLGYDVDSDFETDEITINGDYKPYFNILVGNSYSSNFVTYQDAGIDEEKLLQNVKEIKGKKLLSPLYEPEKDFVIDSSIKYPEKLAKKLDKLLSERTESAKEALEAEDYKTAFDILGYQTTTDDEGNITIQGDYSACLLKSEASPDKTLFDYGIDEKKLLSHVVKIDGNAVFLSDYVPDHYIEAKGINAISAFRSYVHPSEMARRFARINPQLTETVSKAKQALSENDNFSALQILGYEAEKDENGNITINGDYYPEISQKEGGKSFEFLYSAMGIDENKLLQNVKKIDGSMHLWGSNLEKINRDLEVTGSISVSHHEDADSLFNDFISVKNIASLYDTLDESVISSYIRHGIIKPDLKTSRGGYFREFEGENKAFLDNIIANRDKILTSKELQEKYGVSSTSVNNALRAGEFQAYALEEQDLGYRPDSYNYLFDITDERNTKGLKRLERNGKSRLYRANREASAISGSAFNKACIRNDAGCPDASIKSFPADALKRLGYGTKADIMANCMLRVNGYSIKRYIDKNSSYDISTPYMIDILLLARRNNPAVIKLSELQKRLGNSKNEFRQAVIDDKLNIITQNPYRLTYPEDYHIDLSDEKNLAFLKTINNEDFQTWLSNRIEAYETYRSENDKKYEQFKTSKAPTKDEIYAGLQEEYESIAEKRRLEAEEKKLKIRQRKDEVSRTRSLRNTIAWVLSPNTKQVRREQSNSHVQEIFAKHKEAKEINEQLLAGEITLDEAREKISALKLSKQDEIDVLSYHKSCWEISGTDEWKQALQDAKSYMEIYETSGIEGIEDPEMKERLTRWEREHEI